ncbi:hypothetical protein DL96DRAFT_1593240 [Flagelloscypha sp. PMI_526]|nr:hypothetical protein DL96DRAFT_1593240 [Flagelloscypha sp. PMI_526]
MTRTTRRNAASTQSPGPESTTALSKLEALLLSQAVYEVGTNAWPVVAKMLNKSALISRPKSFFTPASCNTMYSLLMKDANLPVEEETATPHSKLNKRLAEIQYVARLAELKQLIAAEETRFRSLLVEIEEIRSGTWDDKLESELSKAQDEDSPSKDGSGSPQDSPEPESPPKTRRTTRAQAQQAQQLSQPPARNTRANRKGKPDSASMDVDTENETTNSDEEKIDDLKFNTEDDDDDDDQEEESEIHHTRAKRKAGDEVNRRDSKRQRASPVAVDETETDTSPTSRRRPSRLTAPTTTATTNSTSAADAKRSQNLLSMLLTQSSELKRDLYLMFANSLMYNRPDTDIYSMAEAVSLLLQLIDPSCFTLRLSLDDA